MAQIVQLANGQTLEVPDGYTEEQIGAAVAQTRMPKSAGPQSDLSRKRLANIQGEQAAANYGQDIRNAWGEFGGTMAKALPVAAAGLATGGLGAPAAMALMGGAGAAGGALSQAGQILGGTEQAPQDWKQSLKGLAWDAGTAAAGEGAGRLLGAAFTKVTPALVKRAADATSDGTAALNDLFVNMRNRFYSIVNQHPVPKINIENDLQTALQEINAIPKGRGAVGQRFSGPTDRAVEIMDAIKADLGSTTAAGVPMAAQPLDALIRIKSSMNKLAYSGKELASEEAAVIQNLAKKLDAKIRLQINALPGEAKAAAMDAYEAQNAVAKSLNEHNVAVKGMEMLLRSGVGKGLGGALLGGGAAGYGSKGDFGSTMAGAAAGAAAAVGIPATATYLVKAISEHPQAMYQLKQGIRWMAEGKGKEAMPLFARAAAIAGVREHLKEMSGWAPEMGEPKK